jgi:hypothetical protein
MRVLDFHILATYGSISLKAMKSSWAVGMELVSVVSETVSIIRG